MGKSKTLVCGLVAVLALPGTIGLYAQQQASARPSGRENLSESLNSMRRTASQKLLPFEWLERGEEAPSAVAPTTPKLLSRKVPAKQVPTAEGTGVTIYGGVYKADNWTTGNFKRGIYAFNAQAGMTFTKVSGEGNDTYLTPLGGAAVYDGKFHGVHYTSVEDMGGMSYSFNYVEYDTQTWERTYNKNVNYNNIAARCNVSINPTNGQVWGLFNNFDLDYNILNRKWGYVDYATLNKTVFDDPMDLNMVALAISKYGLAYAVSSDGGFYIVSQDEINYYKIGDTGVALNPNWPMCAAFDQKNNVFYWSAVTTDGKSGLYTVNISTGEASLVGYYPNNEVVVNMWIPTPEAADEAPAQIQDLAASFAANSLTGNITFTAPTTTYQGSELTGDLTYTIMAGDDVLAQDIPTTAGASVTREVTVPQAGMTTFTVTTANAAGTSPKAQVKLWVGPDAATAPTSAKLDYNADTKQAVVTWNAPQQGANGGAIDPSKLTYKVVRMPGEVTVAENQTSTSFTESLAELTALQAVYYVITPINGTLEGASAETNRVVVGGPLVPPIYEPFNTQAAFDLYTPIDANEDGTTWKWRKTNYTYSANSQYASMVADKNNADDDWLLTPPIMLEKGGVYALSFDVKKQYSPKSYDQALEVWVGQGTDVSNYTLLTDEAIEITEVFVENKGLEVEVPSTGVYHIAFRAISDANSDELMLDNIKLDVSLSGGAPDASTNVTVTPGALGALTATIEFDAPTKGLNGADLTGTITRIVVYNDDNQAVGTITDATPGQHYSVTDNNAKNGLRTYTVIAFNGDNEGRKATGQAFIGQDVPNSPSNPVLTDGGSEAILNWTAPTAGANGLYINPDKVTYNLYTINDDGYAQAYKNNITAPYSTGVETATGEQQLLYYAMDAETTGGKSQLVATNSLLIGAPYTLPYAESFANRQMGDKFVWVEGQDVRYNIGMVDEMVYDNDGGALAFVPNYASDGYFNLGKFSLKGTTAPRLLFNYYAVAGSNATILIEVDKMPQGVAQDVQAINFSSLTQSGWQQAVVDLSAFTGEEYVIVKFHFASSNKVENPVPIIIDNIMMVDGNDSDVAITLNAPSQLAAGITGTFKTVVSNLGQTAAEDITVDLMVNGKKQDSKQIASLAAFSSQNVELEYTALTTDPENTTVQVVANYAPDTRLDNNTAEANVTIIENGDLPVVDDLTASVINGNNVQLVWTEPDNLSKVAVEDFESFEPWSVDDFAPWTTVDGDKAPTYGLSEFAFKNQGTARAFIAFNPSYYGIDTSNEDEVVLHLYAPHSGDQCLASFDAAPEQQGEQPVQTDDWLISPALTGDAQTFSFWAKAIILYGKQEFEVLYSTTDTNPKSFTRLGDVRQVNNYWAQFTIDLPQGAKYFAIHNMNTGGLGMMVDDFTFKSGLIIEGYNIYRDGELIGTVQGNNTSYFDTTIAEAGQYVYNVSVLYAREGESRLSNDAVIEATAISDIVAAESLADADVNVYTVTGALVATGKGAVNHLDKGVYLVVPKGAIAPVKVCKK